MTKTEELIYWLRQCSHEGPGHCTGCPYNKDPYEAGCGKLLSDAALLLEAQTGVTVEVHGLVPEGV